MDEILEVITYSGYRLVEVPRGFLLHEKRVEVMEILDMWIDEDFSSKVRKRFFRVQGNDGETHQIYYSDKTSAWFYVQKNKQ